MYTSKTGNLAITVDFLRGTAVSVIACGTELLADSTPLFRLRLCAPDGTFTYLDAFGASAVSENDSSCTYGGFEAAPGLTVTVTLDDGDWKISVDNPTASAVEWVDFPNVVLKPLLENGGIGEMLYPYNEGEIVSNIHMHRYMDPEYPSLGAYGMFPYMICSQFMAYLFDGHGLYMGVHDAGRAPKAVEFLANGENTEIRLRCFCGTERGGDYDPEFVIHFEAFDGTWEDGAEIYREWFEWNLPDNVKKITENPALPDWYFDTPLVISYPVRGVHDMDKMDPNALFPYCNALPLIDEIAERTGSRILVLLMHWEGTAPWAPPYVWPPFGGEEELLKFIDALHARGDLLGVYCSGFGFTMQSNLNEYNNLERYEKENLECAMCAGPDGRVAISRICTGQRSGYDICVASEKGTEILNEAYQPLFDSDIDYVQILDQNHGGSQYFCYSDKHGHPPVPGEWMTKAMRGLLDGWNARAGKTLFGCESAAAEPFIGNLLFSDNRYELNYNTGRPVPLYSYIYHEYLRNFSGNQVSCGLSNLVDTMRLRMAYSFTAGDCMTLVIQQDGRLMANWGCRDFEHIPDRDKALTFAANMQKFLAVAGTYLSRGRMIKPLSYTCDTLEIPRMNGRIFTTPAVYSTAWELEGKRVQIFVNYTEEDRAVTVGDACFTVPAMNAVLREL